MVGSYTQPDIIAETVKKKNNISLGNAYYIVVAVYLRVFFTVVTRTKISLSI